MPDRLLRRAMAELGDHYVGALAALLVVAIVAVIVAAAGWNTARNAQLRVNRLEFEREAEKKAADTSAVAACFLTMRNRPKVIRIFRSIGATLDPESRRVLNELVNQYAGETPTKKGCLALAAEHGIDPEPFLKPPEDGR